MDSQGKTKIAILGGGMAALTAAFELTATPELQDKYEVTIYQMGWRLGGKCATGRGVFGRLEEHGIHAFVGSYYNALGLMSACYHELSGLLDSGALEGGVIKSFKDALKPSNSIVLWEWIKGQMLSWPFAIAPNELRITTHAEFEQSLGTAKKIMSSMTSLGRLYYDDRVRDQAKPAAPALTDKDYERAVRERAANPGPPAASVFKAVGFLLSLVAWLLSRRRQVMECLAVKRNARIWSSGARTFLSWLNSRNSNIPWSTRIRHIRILANYALTIARGIFTSNYNIFDSGFEILDDINYITWLRYYGLTEESESEPIAINTIDISYNFPDGDNSQSPQMAAGTYLRWFLRSLLNLQAFVWSFEAGTGETIIAPLYHVLKHRGVKFAFFHKVTALRLSSDQRDIGAIEVDVQAKLKDGLNAYDPLVRIQHDPDDPDGYLSCWPNRPRYDLLRDGDELEARDDDLESYWAPPSARGEPVILRAGADYDKIVFAISIGAAPYLFLDLGIMDPPASDEVPQAADWRAMVSGVPACATQTLQVWLDKASHDLGAAALNPEAPSRYGVVSGTFVAPFNGQADFTRLIRYEGWKCDEWKELVSVPPKSLWYFSGALTLRYPKPGDPPLRASDAGPVHDAGEPRAEATPFADHAFPRQQNDRVWDFSVQFLQATAGYLLPKASQPWQPLGLDFGSLKGLDPGDAPGAAAGSDGVARRNAVIALYDLIDPAKGTTALHNQFWKANIEPSERYVQCPPGGTKARLEAGGSGFGNMVLAGDWIRNRLNVGSVEGAVMGGKLAAHALCGSPSLDDIVGYGAPAPPARQFQQEKRSVAARETVGVSSAPLGRSSVPDPFRA
jgi:uncharacterized protein with NAD-binding domain and iron-sulfur cluster